VSERPVQTTTTVCSLPNRAVDQGPKNEDSPSHPLTIPRHRAEVTPCHLPGKVGTPQKHVPRIEKVPPEKKNQEKKKEERKKWRGIKCPAKTFSFHRSALPDHEIDQGSEKAQRKKRTAIGVEPLQIPTSLSLFLTRADVPRPAIAN